MEKNDGETTVGNYAEHILIGTYGKAAKYWKISGNKATHLCELVSFIRLTAESMVDISKVRRDKINQQTVWFNKGDMIQKIHM